MANYLLTHYKGIYRIRAPYDLSTNDFIRKENGLYEDIDCYIDCYNNIQIFYYGKRGLLEAYIPSLGKGRNIIKNIYSDFIQDIEQSPYLKISATKNNEIKTYDYDGLYADKELNKVISNIIETDEEVIFRFHSDYMKRFEKYLRPKISAADRSPFSNKNLPKSDYKIPDEDLNTYKNIVSKIPQKDVLMIKNILNEFLKSLATKKNPIEKTKADMRLKCMTSRQYIHSIGQWENLIKYLEKEICQI